eukprot:615591-Rhodomonas_salina.3
MVLPGWPVSHTFTEFVQVQPYLLRPRYPYLLRPRYLHHLRPLYPFHLRLRNPFSVHPTSGTRQYQNSMWSCATAAVRTERMLPQRHSPGTASHILGTVLTDSVCNRSGTVLTHGVRSCATRTVLPYA